MISKKRFEHLVVQALSVNGKGKWESIADMVSDAHALIKAVEAESEVVTVTKMDLDKPAVKLIALPLVEESK
jgi:hypothetical protein